VTTVEFSVEVEAPPSRVWVVASDPSNLPHWDRHIVEVRAPEGGLTEGASYEVIMGFMAVRTTVKAEVLEWEPPFRSKVRLEGLLEATVTTSIAPLPRRRSVLRHEISYRFKGPFGGLGAASLNAVGGAHMALRRGVLAQKKEAEEDR
jgi:uncharacterized protein YndB with AHSA1/START domain